MVHAFKNSRKIAVCLALALIVAFAGFALNSRSVRADERSGTGWTLTDDGTLTIGGGVNFSEVSELRNGANVKKLVVGSGINYIEHDAFQGFQFLETVELSSEIKYIQPNAFLNCQKLTSINLEGVQLIDNNAFSGCFSLSSVSLGNEIDVHSHAFYFCKNLSSVSLGGLKDIPNYAFGSCTSLKTIDLSGVEHVGQYAFEGCTALEKVELGNIKTVLTYACFKGCTKLSDINLDYVEDIGSFAFNGCTSLESVALTNVHIVSNNAFEGCTGLTTINLPIANSIGRNAFTGCTGLTTVNFGGSSVSVGDEAFKNCSSLTTINTEKISAIYDGVFSNCTSLQTVTLGSGIEDIGVQSFYQCSALTTINLANIKTIKTQAFAGCVLLNNIDISDCPYIYANAFNGCTGLTSVDLSGTTSLYQGAFSGCTELTAVILREDLSYIPDYAFDGCSKLTSANIDAPFIGKYAFRNTGFTSLDLRNVSAFSDGAFAGCAITNLTLGYKFGSYTNSDDPAKDSFVFENVTKLYYFGPQRLFDERGIGADFPNAEVTVGGAYYVIIDYVEYQMSEIVEEGELLTVPGEPSRTGFKFTGWYSDKACTIPFDFSKPVTKDLTIYTGWIKDVSESVFKGYTVSLEGDIGVNYYTIMPEDADPDRDYMKFTVEDEPGAQIIYIKDASTITYDGTTYRVFKIRVPAKKMTASIDAQLYVNDQRVAEKWWTVKNYADYILSNPSKYKTAEPLVRAMLHYGAYAQIFFNYKTDKLANANLINDTNYTLNDAVFTRPYDSSKTSLPAGLEFSNVSLTLQTTTTLNLYFTDNTNKNLTFKLVNGTKETTITPIVSGSQKLIKITNIPAGSLDSEYTVKIVVEGDSTEYVVKYNPMTYAYNVITREQTEVRTPELKNLMKALYLYSEAAKKYINS